MYYAATTFATCASLAVFILLDSSLAASAPVYVPVLTHHSFPSDSNDRADLERLFRRWEFERRCSLLPSIFGQEYLK
ncbi:hypothetical protein [Lysinibacillus sp. CTST325]